MLYLTMSSIFVTAVGILLKIIRFLITYIPFLPLVKYFKSITIGNIAAAAIHIKILS